MVNPFTADGFSLQELTAAINKVPNEARYIGRMDRLGLFRPRPIRTTTFSIEEQAGVLNLLTSVPRGGPAPKNTTGKRKLRNFAVPHHPLEDVIKPEEAQGIRSFGSENEMMALADVMNRKLAEMRRKHDLTKEYLRMGALKGIILDGDGSTVLYNLFTEFGLSQYTVDWDLDDSTTDVNAKCRGVVDYITDKLQGDMMTGVDCQCSRSFYNALIAHASVKEAFKYFSTTQQLSGNFAGGPFLFGGIRFEPFEAITTNPAGSTVRFVEDHYAYAFPVGGNETFIEVIAPADFNETVNTYGLPYYAKQKNVDFDRGTEVHTQMNVLPMCTRPEVLVKIGENID